MTSEERTESPSALEAVMQICAFVLTSYPLVAPLLSQLREELRESFEQVVEALPRRSQALSEIEVDREVTERLANQLLEAVPELERFFQRLRR